MRVLLFVVILLSVASITSSLHRADTMRKGDVLNVSEYTFLVSANTYFTLGFYTPPDRDDENTYLAIWFNMSTQPVWIGNRDYPLPNNASARLFIDDSGRLILTHNETKGDTYPLSLKQTSTDSNVTATLLDSGNFVLREVNHDGSFGQELWSSFDNPTDTLMPGMKLGVNHRTGKKWILTSWLDFDNPGSGALTLEWESSRRRMVMKYRGVIHWTTGELNGPYHFQHGDGLGTGDQFGLQNYKFSNVSTKEEEYFNYSATPFRFLDEVMSREEERANRLAAWRLDSRGAFISIVTGFWITGMEQCYGYENETQQSQGCELWSQPECRNGIGETFEERSGEFRNKTRPDNPFVYGVVTENSSYSRSDCRENCWKDCDCVGYRGNIRATGARATTSDYGDGMCVYYKGKDHLEWVQDFTGRSHTMFVLNRPSKSSVPSKKWISRILVPVTVTSSVLTLVLVCILLLRRRRRKREKQALQELLTLEGYTDVHELSNNECVQGINLKIFSHAWVAFATKNFSSDHKLGQGGFGSVYKGVTPEGQEVAIKQLSERSKQGIIEFKNEVVLISRLQHTNLVKLLGFCIHGGRKMLIYEFLPNKSLDVYLFDPDRKEQLTWERRLNIIIGIAQGLLYLHMHSRVRIIHRDMKASNILLDENMNPKISDFGMAKILRQDTTEANTRRLAGTYGYMAPEYATRGIFSTKSDVYSFGVLVLEIISGKKINCFRSGHDEPLNLVEHGWELWNRDAVLELVDPAIRDECGGEEESRVRRCINMALLCVEDSAPDRPSMSEVISMITNANSTLPKPKKLAFVSRCGAVNTFEKDNRSDMFSVNELSISSAMDAR